MSTKIPTNGHELDATTVAAMIAKAEAVETAAPRFGAKVAIPVRCQDYDDDAGAFDFSAAFGSVNAFAAMQAECVA